MPGVRALFSVLGGHNTLGEEDVRRLVSAMQHNTSLTTFRIRPPSDAVSAAVKRSWQRRREATSTVTFVLSSILC